MTERQQQRKAKLALEKKKLSEMKSFKDKKDYILDYYKFHIISVILIITLILYVINTVIINPPDKTGVGLIITNGTLQNSELLKASAEAEIGIEEGYELTISSLPLGSTQDISYEQAMQQKLFALIVSGDADLVIGVEEFFTANSTASLFSDTSQLLTDSKYQVLQDRLLYGLVPIDMLDASTVSEKDKVKYNTGTEEIICVNRPIGIKIDGCKVLEDLGFDTKGSIIGFTSTSKRPEITLRLLDYLLAIK